MGPLVLEMELILMYYGAGTCDGLQCSMQRPKWTSMEMTAVQLRLKWWARSSGEPRPHLRGVAKFATGILLLESECSQQKASDPTVRVVSGVTARQRGIGITVSFLLLRQVQKLPPHTVLSCPFVNFCHCLSLCFFLMKCCN